MRELDDGSSYFFAGKARELEEMGKSIIHMEIGQPDFNTPQAIQDAGIEAIARGKTKYNPSLGIPELRAAVAQEVNRARGTDVVPGQVGITPGGKAALTVVLGSLLEPGDEVICPDPGFNAYRNILSFFRATPRFLHLEESRGFGFDVEALARLISPKTKALILNSPSNPTGGVISRKDLEQIADILAPTAIWVLSDEIYSRIVYGPEEYISPLSIKGLRERTILIDGFSKTYSMTGWRLGYFVAPPSVMPAMEALVTHGIGCTATFTQHAALRAFAHCEKEVEHMVSEFKRRRDFLVGALRKIDGVSCCEPQGAFYVFPNVSVFGKSSHEMARVLLEKGGVSVLPGSIFGAHGEGYLRISYATSLEHLQEGARRIEACLGSFKRI